MDGVQVIERDGRNPLLVVSEAAVETWLRALADSHGYADRSGCAVQIRVRNHLTNDVELYNGAPEIVYMVSNIQDSRSPQHSQALKG